MAALCQGNIKRLYLCKSKEKLRDLLVEIWHYPPCDEEEDPRTVILLDFCVESVYFASENGFSWQQGLALFQLMQELRETALGLSLLQATELFKSLLKNYVDVFQDRTTTVVDFVFSLFLNHFHLYKFVFNNEKESDITCQELSIESPPGNLLPLSGGIEKTEWDEQQALKNLEAEHTENMRKRQLQFDVNVQELETVVREKLALLDNQADLTRSELKTIIEETVKVFVASASNNIAFSIEENQQYLEYEFSKAAVTQRRESPVHTPTKKRSTKTKASGKR